MESKQAPKSFVVLESAPTSEDEFSSIIISQENHQTISRQTNRQPVFQAIKTEFAESPEEDSQFRTPDLRHKRSRPVEGPDKQEDRSDSCDSLQRLLEEDDFPKSSKSKAPQKRPKSLPKTSKRPVTNIEALKLELDSLESTFALQEVDSLLTCRLCGGFMRHPQCMLECLHTFCKVCAFRWMIETENINKCPTCLSPVSSSTTNLLLESVIAKLATCHQTEASLRLPLAQRVMSSVGYYSREKLLQNQRVLLGTEKTVAFLVQLDDGNVKAWEVPVEFTVLDAKELIRWKGHRKGELTCKGIKLADDLLLGFIHLYLWRTEDILELEVVPQ